MCKKAKRLERSFYITRPDARTFKARYQYHCKACQGARVGARQRRQRTDPATRRAVLDQHNARQRRWREENRPLYRSGLVRYREKRKQDPERYARHLENQRIAYRLRKEREGTPVRYGHRDVVMSTERGGHLPAGPFAKALQAIIDNAQAVMVNGGSDAAMPAVSLDEACEALGISARRFYGWRTGESEHVPLDVVDRVLPAADLFWWEVWAPEEYPAVAAALGGT